MENEATIRELMQRFRDRLDPEAFEQIVAQMTKPALAVAQKLLFDLSGAEDAVQEAFLRIVRSRDLYKTTRPFKAWFFTILRNVCRDMLRKRTRHAKAIAAVALQTPEQTDPPTPAGRDIRQLMRRLPPDARMALELRVVEGLSFREVAAALGISEEAAKKRAQRALRQLRNLHRQTEIRAEASGYPGRERAGAMATFPQTLSPMSPLERNTL